MKAWVKEEGGKCVIEKVVGVDGVVMDMALSWGAQWRGRSGDGGGLGNGVSDAGSVGCFVYWELVEIVVEKQVESECFLLVEDRAVADE